MRLSLTQRVGNEQGRKPLPRNGGTIPVDEIYERRNETTCDALTSRPFREGGCVALGGRSRASSSCLGAIALLMLGGRD